MTNPAFTGPPDPKLPEIRQLQGRDRERSNFKELIPLISSQLMDLFTTEIALNTKPAHTPYGFVTHGREGNPLPGMQGSLGRLGWGAAETVLTHLLTKNKPKLRKAAKTIIPTIHGAFGMHNAASSQNEDVISMLMRGRK